jgi:hypothetical protein
MLRLKHPPSPSAPAVQRRRGRPPKPGGRKSQVEVQRAYRARRKAAGKVLRLVDANPVSPVPPAIPDYDPETHLSASDRCLRKCVMISMMRY